MTALPRPSAPTVLAWFAFAGGLAAYATHLVVVFWLLAADCPPGTRAVVVVATVLAAAVAAAAVAAGRRLHRQATDAVASPAGGHPHPDPHPHPPLTQRREGGRAVLVAVAGLAALRRQPRPAPADPPEVSSAWDVGARTGWRPWLGTVGMGLSALSLLIIVLSGVAALVLPECGR